jgi:hypothetical protein
MTKTNVFALGKDDNGAAVTLTVSALTKHSAYLGASGSGKTTAALNIIEQAALSGVPVIIIDRKGDLSGYGGFPDLPPSKRGPWEEFFSKVEPVIYTPGHPSGRGLQVRLSPEGVEEMDPVDRENALNMAAHALGDMLGYKEKGADAQKRAIIFQALLLMLNVRDQHGKKFDINLRNLIHYIASKSPVFLQTIANLDLENVQKIVQDLSTFSLDKGRILTQKGEAMTMDNLLGRNDAKNPRTRISIISTKFLGSATLFFVAQLFIEAARWASKNPSNTLQAMLFVDEADIYMPARGNAATKEPLLNLLKRGRSAGLSVGLATQSPGEMDYQGRNNVDTWFIGKIKELVALKKVEPMVAEPELMHDIPFQNVGEFMLVTGSMVTRLRSNPSMMHTAQLSEDQILALAKAGPPSLASIHAKIRERKSMEG